MEGRQDLDEDKHDNDDRMKGNSDTVNAHAGQKNMCNPPVSVNEDLNPGPGNDSAVATLVDSVVGECFAIDKLPPRL